MYVYFEVCAVFHNDKIRYWAAVTFRAVSAPRHHSTGRYISISSPAYVRGGTFS